MPSYLKEVEYLAIKDINFISARGRKRTLDDQIIAVGDLDEQPNGGSCASNKPRTFGTRSTESDLALLFRNLSVGGTKPAILSLIPNFSEEFVPKSSCKGFPPPLKSLKSLKYVKMEYHDLLTACESVSVDITKEMADSVEKATRDQSNSKLSQ